MYESAQFISSGSHGLTVPDTWPTYPHWKLIRGYIRDFAATYGPYDLVKLNTSIERAELVDGGWRVTDSDGDTETFKRRGSGGRGLARAAGA